jgi:hypothetical protein
MTETPESPGTPETPTGPPAGAGPPAPPPPAPPPETAADEYPVHGDIEHQVEYSRFMPLVKWLLLIPHYIVLILLAIGALFAIIISFFAVIITRRYPRGLFDYVLGVSRWIWRVQAYLLLMVDPYPPFTLQDDPNYPARLDIEYPEEGVARWRPLFAWILAIPYLIISSILFQLAQILAFFAFFTILFTKKYPEGMFKIALVGLRWQVRGNAYAYWLTTKYPPFVWA